MNTPRTDALHHQWLAEFPEPLARYITCLGHARQLETELTAAQVRIAELERERVIKQTHIENLNESITDLTAKLAAAEADAKRLDWMQFHGARVCWGNDGEMCTVRWYDEAREEERTTAVCSDWRAAIDLAAQEGK